MMMFMVAGMNVCVVNSSMNLFVFMKRVWPDAEYLLFSGKVTNMYAMSMASKLNSSLAGYE